MESNTRSSVMTIGERDKKYFSVRLRTDLPEGVGIATREKAGHRGGSGVSE